jgi:ABC-type iron transport system FetAB ATPase subunit
VPFEALSAAYWRSLRSDDAILPRIPVAKHSFVSAPLLSIDNLDCGSVRNVSFGLAAGECVALVGPSGSGKSRLLRAIADLDPHTGKAFLRGEARQRMPAHRWRRRVGYLPAESAWWGDLVADHMAAPAAAELPALGLPDEVMDWPVSRLSSGERQRLALLRLLIIRPDVLLLDEPTANLDPDSAERVEQLLRRRQQQGTGLVWVSHDEAQIRRVADRGFRIVDSQLEPLPAWT